MKISHIFSSIVAFLIEVGFIDKNTIKKQNGVQTKVTLADTCANALITFYWLW